MWKVEGLVRGGINLSRECVRECEEWASQLWLRAPILQLKL